MVVRVQFDLDICAAKYDLIKVDRGVFNLTLTFVPRSNLTAPLPYLYRFPYWWPMHLVCIYVSSHVSYIA